jgi:hypothetical protein
MLQVEYSLSLVACSLLHKKAAPKLVKRFDTSTFLHTRLISKSHYDGICLAMCS